MSKKRLDELLDKMNREAISEDESDELWNYIYPGDTPVFEYIETACKKNYIPAYYAMGKILSHGKICKQDWNKAIDYWQLSVQNGGEGFIELGDCYRLGTGVEKNYAIARKYYLSAIEFEHERGECPEAKEILLQTIDSRSHDFMESTCNTPGMIEWWEYIIQFIDTPSIEICHAMANLYTNGCEKNLFWLNKASEYGDISAKCILFDYATDDFLKRQHIASEIFSDTTSTCEQMMDIAGTVLLDNRYSDTIRKKAFNFLYEHTEVEVSKLFSGNEAELEDFIREYEQDHYENF